MPLAPATKTVSDVVNRVKRQFGDESGAQITDADILRWVNDGQLEVNKTNKIIKTVATTVTVAGQAQYQLPGVNILSIERVQVNNVPIQYRTFAQVQELIFNDSGISTITAALPTCWYDYGDSIFLFPPPDGDGVTISIFCVTYPSLVTSVSDSLVLPDIYFEPLIQYIMAQAHELDDDLQGSVAKLGQYNAAMDALGPTTDGYSDQYYRTITVMDEDS